jgi:CBS domain-containing protein
LAAFTAIERHFKSRLNDDDAPFADLVELYAQRFAISTPDRDALHTFRRLRNLLVHNRSPRGGAVAEPVAEVVEAIERARQRILNPPTVLQTLEHRPVVHFSPSDAISSVLDEVRKEGYSQFPIYESGKFRGLLTANCISRWLADRLATVGLVESETVGEVMKFTEPQDHAVHLPKTVTAMQAIRAMSPPTDGRPAPQALIVTDTGKTHERPLAIVVAEDVALLFRTI